MTSIPPGRAPTSFCFDNAAERGCEKGETIAYGRAIWHMPGLLFEPEHHAVSRNKLGNLIDVSPQTGGRKRLLFLPENGAVYDPFVIRHPDGNSERALRKTDLGTAGTPC